METLMDEYIEMETYWCTYGWYAHENSVIIWEYDNITH